MSHVLHRKLSSNPPVAATGDGLYIVDAGGKQYLDACGGAAVSILGHGNARVIEAIQAGSGFFQHGHTFMGHALAAAAALATLQVIRDDNLLAKVVTRGRSLQEKLKTALGEHAHVGDIRGRGLFIGIEFVSDRQNKVPFDSDLKLHQIIKAQAMREGLLCYAMGGTVDGKLGDHVLIAPAYTLDVSHEDEIVTKISCAINASIPQ